MEVFYFMRKKIVFMIVMASMLAAIAVVLDKCSFKISLFADKYTLKLTFYGLPLMIAGMIFGPKTGFLAGLITGIVTQIIISEYGFGPTTLIWMVAPILWGWLSGIMMKLLKGNNHLLNIIISVITVSLIVSLFNSFAIYIDSLVYHYSSGLTFALIMIRLLISILIALIYIPCIYMLMKRITKDYSYLIG